MGKGEERPDLVGQRAGASLGEGCFPHLSFWEIHPSMQVLAFQAMLSIPGTSYILFILFKAATMLAPIPSGSLASGPMRTVSSVANFGRRPE